MGASIQGEAGAIVIVNEPIIGCLWQNPKPPKKKRSFHFSPPTRWCFPSTQPMISAKVSHGWVVFGNRECFCRIRVAFRSSLYTSDKVFHHWCFFSSIERKLFSPQAIRRQREGKQHVLRPSSSPNWYHSSATNIRLSIGIKLKLQVQ